MAVAGRAAGVGVEHEEAGVREDVERPEKRVAIGAVRAAVDLQDHRVRPSGLVANRSDEPPFDLGAVGDGPGQPFGRLQGDAVEPLVVERGYPPLQGAVAAVDVDLGG